MMNFKRLKLKIVFSSLSVLVLVVALAYTTRVRPIEVGVSGGDASPTAMLRRLGSEMRKHPYAVMVSVAAKKPGARAKLVRYDRRTRMFHYDSGGMSWHHEWSYRDVNEKAATYIAQNAVMRQDASLSLPSETLDKYGCNLIYFALVPPIRELD